MTLPNRIGYFVQRQPEVQPQQEQTTPKSPPPKPKKRKKQEDVLQKEDLQTIKKKFDLIVENNLLKVKESHVLFNVQNEERVDFSFKKRKVTETESIEILDGDDLLKRSILETDKITLQFPDERISKYLKENVKEIYEKISKNVENITYEAIRDFEKDKSFSLCHEKVVKLVKNIVDSLEEEKEEKKEEFKLEPINSQKSIIDMSAQEILLVFVGKNDPMEDKQEETSNFLSKFLILQKTYKEEAETINESRKEWLEKYEKLFKEQSKFRYISQLEQDRVYKDIDTKINKILTLLKDKYLSKVFTLQENVLMKSKKRGNLPKTATNVLKNWLFQHFLHPYPSEDEKREISRQTNLTITQINNWFINARVRTWRPMLENMLEGERDKKSQKIEERQQQVQQQIPQQQQQVQQQPQMNTFWQPPNYQPQLKNVEQGIPETFDYSYVHPTGIIPSWVTKRFEHGDDSHLEDE